MTVTVAPAAGVESAAGSAGVGVVFSSPEAAGIHMPARIMIHRITKNLLIG